MEAFETALQMIPLSENGRLEMFYALVGITEDFMREPGNWNEKYIWLYSLPFIHFFGGKQTAEWVPNSLQNRRYQDISSEKMIHLLRIDPHFSHAFLRSMEFQFLVKRILDKSEFIFNIDFLMLLIKVMTENR